MKHQCQHISPFIVTLNSHKAQILDNRIPKGMNLLLEPYHPPPAGTNPPSTTVFTVVTVLFQLGIKTNNVLGN